MGNIPLFTEFYLFYTSKRWVVWDFFHLRCSPGNSSCSVAGSYLTGREFTPDIARVERFHKANRVDHCDRCKWSYIPYRFPYTPYRWPYKSMGNWCFFYPYTGSGAISTDQYLVFGPTLYGTSQLALQPPLYLSCIRNMNILGGYLMSLPTKRQMISKHVFFHDHRYIGEDEPFFTSTRFFSMGGLHGRLKPGVELTNYRNNQKILNRFPRFPSLR